MQNINYAFLLSRPVWGAWIEMNNMLSNNEYAQSRAPYGARGLKFLLTMGILLIGGGRAPYGARGLKLLIGGAIGIFGRVAPRMGRVD